MCTALYREVTACFWVIILEVYCFLLKIFQLEVSTVLNVIQPELISSLEGGDLHSTETY